MVLWTTCTGYVDNIILKEYETQRCCGGEIDLKEQLWRALDKRKQDVCICCPAFWQQEFKRWFDDQDVEKVYPDIKSVEKIEFHDDVNEKITNMRSKLSYTSAYKKKEHSFGQISFIPKALLVQS